MVGFMYATGIGGAVPKDQGKVGCYVVVRSGLLTDGDE